MNRVKFALLAAGTMLVMAFTFSCSSDDGGNENGGGGGSSTETKTYVLKDVVPGEQFTYEETGTSYGCRNDGVFEKKTYTHPKTIDYSISNNIMVWKNKWAYEESDTLNFKGTANELTGTWTRTKNKATSCERRDCKEDYDITKAVFTGTTVAITRESCSTDYMEDGKVDENGWKTKVINCNTFEVSKGSDKVTVTGNYSASESSESMGPDGDGGSSWAEVTIVGTYKISYNGKSCEMSELSVPKQEKACKDAWECKNSSATHCDGYIDLIMSDFNKCLSNLLPAGLK